MKVLSCVQNKGGVGKTTLTKLLAEWFARRGTRVLVIDLDAQCNLSRRFLTMRQDTTDPDGVLPPVHPGFDSATDKDWDGISSSADIYHSRLVVPYPTRIDGVHALPGHGPRLRAIEFSTQDQARARVLDQLHAFLAKPDVQEQYDLALIDTAPAKGPLTMSAVRAATHLVIPSVMEQQPLEGLQGMFTLWRAEQRTRNSSRPLTVAAIQVNLFRKGVGLHEGILQSMRQDTAMGPLISPAIICQRIAFAETDRDGAEPVAVFDLPAKDPARLEATAMCEHIERQMFARELGA